MGTSSLTARIDNASVRIIFIFCQEECTGYGKYALPTHSYFLACIMIQCKLKLVKLDGISSESM